MSDSKPNCLKNRINSELHKVDIWLRKNKLSLNYCKTNKIIYNKQTNKIYENDFWLTINKTSLKKVNFIKYLRVFFDNKLSWDDHIDNLCQWLLNLLEVPNPVSFMQVITEPFLKIKKFLINELEPKVNCASVAHKIISFKETRPTKH